MPPSLRKQKDRVDQAIKTCTALIELNYISAVPQYYPKEDCIQFLLPLCLEDVTKPDLALAVGIQEGGKAYVGYTILTLDWAYSNARLLRKPGSDWLSANKVQEVSDPDEEGDASDE